LATACRFGEATSLLGKIPAARQSALIRDHIQSYDSLARARAAAAHAMKAAAPGTYEEACELANVYEILLQPSGISDPEFSTAIQGLKATLANEARTQRWMTTFLYSAAGTVVAAVFLVAGAWLRNSPWLRPSPGALESSRANDSLISPGSNTSIHTSEPELQPGLVEKTCLNGCLLMRVPKDFAGLSQQELEGKYPGYSNAKNSIEEWASRDGTVSIAVTAVPLSDIPGAPHNLAAVQDFLDSQLRRNQSISVREWKKQTVHGQEWRHVVSEATVDSERHQEVSAITVANSKMLSVTFKATSQRPDAWLPLRDELLQSLKVTCP
jgi:hypothetical protein